MSAGDALVGPLQHPAGFLCCSSTVLTLTELVVCQYSQVLFYRTDFYPLGLSHIVLHSWIIFSQQQDLTLVFVQLCKVLISSLLLSRSSCSLWLSLLKCLFLLSLVWQTLSVYNWSHLPNKLWRLSCLTEGQYFPSVSAYCLCTWRTLFCVGMSYFLILVCMKKVLFECVSNLSQDVCRLYQLAFFLFSRGSIEKQQVSVSVAHIKILQVISEGQQ